DGRFILRSSPGPLAMLWSQPPSIVRATFQLEHVAGAIYLPARRPAWGGGGHLAPDGRSSRCTGDGWGRCPQRLHWLYHRESIRTDDPFPQKPRAPLSTHLTRWTGAPHAG